MPQKKTSLSQGWFVYILQCRDASYYTGITTDLERRCKQHNEGYGARYTRARRPVKLIYSENCEDRSQALRREYELKSLPRSKKYKLVISQLKRQ